MTFIGHVGDTGFNWRNEDEDEAGKITVRQRFIGRRPQS
jgi:hypothetical protein